MKTIGHHGNMCNAAVWFSAGSECRCRAAAALFKRPKDIVGWAIESFRKDWRRRFCAGHGDRTYRNLWPGLSGPLDEDIDKLKAASASESLLKAIETAKIPPLPPPKLGSSAVSCEPVDCDVNIERAPGPEARVTATCPGFLFLKVRSH